MTASYAATITETPTGLAWSDPVVVGQTVLWVLWGRPDWSGSRLPVNWLAYMMPWSAAHRWVSLVGVPSPTPIDALAESFAEHVFDEGKNAADAATMVWEWIGCLPPGVNEDGSGPWKAAMDITSVR